MKQKILVPVDHSTITNDLIKIADEWAQRINAQLYFLHVATSNEPEKGKQTPLFEFFLRKRVTSKYYEVRRYGKPYNEILTVAGEIKPNLMIMGAHDHLVVDRLFLGSNTDYVIHHAICPIYIHKQSDVLFGNKIVVPIDYTLINRNVIKIADQWSKRENSELYFVQTIAPPEPEPFYMTGSFGESGSVEESRYQDSTTLEKPSATDQVVCDQHTQRLKRFLEECQVTAPHHPILRVGKPYEQIHQLQKEINAKLIMMAAHFHTKLDRILTGSNTDYLLHHVECPMYVFKEQQ